MPLASINGTDIFYEILGDGEPLVFLNGVMMTTQSWALETRELSKRRRCVMHDFRGQLRSGKPKVLRMDEHVNDLVALLDLLSIERADVAGTSYGGEVGMMLAARHPDRVKRLTVITSVSHVGEELRRKIEGWIGTALTSPQDIFEATMRDNYSPEFLEEHPEVVFAARERLRALPPEYFTSLADLCEAFLRLDIDDELPRIECPTLVVAAEKDTLKPVAYSEFITARIAGAELQVVPDAGHAVVIENPAAVIAAIDGPS